MPKSKPQKKRTKRCNPFEPSGSGSPLQEAGFWMPTKWRSELTKKINALDSGSGRRAIAVIGAYGSGKSYILRWLERVELPKRRILSYYFENPEVKFYDLANSLLRRIGRKHFAKLVFELAATFMTRNYKTLFSSGFQAFLEQHRARVPKHVLGELRQAIAQTKIADDEEIVDCLARIVADTGPKPYFEYRDFVTSKSGSYVAEKQEPKYFNAIIEVLRRGDGVGRVAFLVDEFEQVSLQRKLTRKDAQDYLVTLKRLVDVTAAGDFWLILAMTPDAWETTKAVDPALGERCYDFAIPPLAKEDALALVRERFEQVEPKWFPYGENCIDVLRPTTYENPRRIVKVFHVATTEAMRTGKRVSNERLTDIEQELYPLEDKS